MAVAAPQWTEPLRISLQRADPSGVTSASTEYQARLLPGMSTLTNRVRYLSLFAAARGLRMAAGKSAEDRLPLNTHLRRLEALIGVCTVRHHQQQGVPTGIIGRGDAVKLAVNSEITLALNVVRPAYSIYFGSLAALGLLDDSKDFAPLYKGARPLAESWNVAAAGPLGAMLADGVLPKSVPRDLVDAHAASFCLCQTPRGSEEETALVRRLFALDDAQINHVTEGDLVRSASWRLLLELVRRTPTAKLENQATIIRLLQPDLAALAETTGELPPRLCQSLIHWRWVAARTLFEHGWVQAFILAVRIAGGERLGLTSSELRTELGRGPDVAGVTLDRFDEHVRAEYESASWLKGCFEGSGPRDGLALLLAGLHHAACDRVRYSDKGLETHWSAGDIPFSALEEQFAIAVQRGADASGFWAEVGEASLEEHVRISLRKMSTGLPDSLLLDFDDGRWLVPAKARNVPLYPAGAYTRLDTALWWAREMGLVDTTLGDLNVLTQAGDAICAEWDEVHGA